MNRVVITAAEAVCALGGDLETCLQAWQQSRSGLTPEDGLLVGRIQDRSPLKGRRYGAASNLALHVARRAVARAGWTPEQTREAWIYAASSRGNAAELLAANAWRRPSRRFSASNTLHSEIAAAVSIELGVKGPWHMISNGCSSSLDALGHAWMAMRSGMAKRVIVVTVDLPLLPEILRDFRDTGLLARNEVNDPYSAQTTGFHPGEAAAAVTLENDGMGCQIESYHANSDAYDSLAIPESGQGLVEILSTLPKPDCICPHATGTPSCAVSEWNALIQTYGESIPPILFLKPFTGHTLGASGLLDVVLLQAALLREVLPRNLHPIAESQSLTPRIPPNSRALKIAAAMGGHNCAVMLSRSR